MDDLTESSNQITIYVASYTISQMRKLILESLSKFPMVIHVVKLAKLLLCVVESALTLGDDMNESCPQCPVLIIPV